MKTNNQRHTPEHLIALPIAFGIIGHRQIQYNNVCSRNDENSNIDILAPITTKRSALMSSYKRQTILRITQRMLLIRELRQQRGANNLSCGAFRQIGPFLEHLKKDINNANKKERTDEGREPACSDIKLNKGRNKKLRANAKKVINSHHKSSLVIIMH